MFYKRCFGYTNLLLAFDLAFATNFIFKICFQTLESPLGHYPIQSKYKQGKKLQKQFKKYGWKWKMNLKINIKLDFFKNFVQQIY